MVIFCGTLLKNHLVCGWIFRRVKFARLRWALIYNSCRSKRCVDSRMRMISGAWSFTPVWIFIQPQHFGCSSFAPRFMAILCHARCSTCDINNENYVLRSLNIKRAHRRCTYFRPQHTHVPTICRRDLSTALVAYTSAKFSLWETISALELGLEATAQKGVFGTANYLPLKLKVLGNLQKMAKYPIMVFRGNLNCLELFLFSRWRWNVPYHASLFQKMYTFDAIRL